MVKIDCIAVVRICVIGLILILGCSKKEEEKQPTDNAQEPISAKGNQLPQKESLETREPNYSVKSGVKANGSKEPVTFDNVLKLWRREGKKEISQNYLR